MSEQHTVQQLHFHWKDKYILKLLLFPPLFPLPALLYNSLEEPRTGKERGEEEQRGAAPLTSHQRGETQWLRSHQLYASCSSCSPSLPPVPLPFSPSSSRLPPPPSVSLTLFLCQPILSHWLSLLWPVFPFSTPLWSSLFPPISHLQKYSVLWWQLPLSPS